MVSLSSWCTTLNCFAQLDVSKSRYVRTWPGTILVNAKIPAVLRSPHICCRRRPSGRALLVPAKKLWGFCAHTIRFFQEVYTCGRHVTWRTSKGGSSSWLITDTSSLPSPCLDASHTPTCTVQWAPGPCPNVIPLKGLFWNQGSITLACLFHNFAG